MNTRPWLRWMLAAFAISLLALFAVACGDDDDDDNGGGSGDTATTASGDNNTTPEATKSGSDSNANPSNADEKYVGQICKATLNFFNALRAIDPAVLADEEKSFDALEKPFGDLVKAVEDADPPNDAKSFHEEFVKQMKAYHKAVQEHDQETLDQLDQLDLPEPPGNLQARMEAAAANNKDCQATGTNFGE